ncbi:hypothetical protein WMF20_12930 [Sorangium sp. So ce834]|uniref:spermidine synthase n=1 Tax=Sorangium sp. So ce834 TaxID=3133321 RepID=UPI003F5E6111
MRLLVAVLVATLGGYLALSHEVLWVRVYSFATEGEPEAFGLLLAAYLAGLAGGSLLAGRYCRSAAAERSGQLYRVGGVIGAGALAAFLVAPAVAHLAGRGVDPASTLPVFALASTCLGAGFPLLCHFGIPADELAGARLSYVYVGNIAGSTLGSLVTGLVLLDVSPLRELNVALAIAGAALGAMLMLSASRTARSRVFCGALLAAAVASFVGSAPTLYGDLYEKLLYGPEYREHGRFADVIERREGVVTVSRSGTVYGGGSYEGIANVSPLPDKDENRVLRAYLVSAFHPQPRDILMIGLGSGSWLQVLANDPDVEHLTVIEINPGFVEAARRAPVVASALDNPKVELLIDDGRRYLGRTSRRFDVIVENTIVHWRSYASMLLSREMMELSRRHLKLGGALYYNTTMSTAAQKTGATVFPYAVRYQNMLIASDGPITIDRARFERKLDAWHIDGRPVLPAGSRAAQLDLLKEQDWRGGPTWESRESILQRTQGDPIITDDNMATEWWAFDTYP